MRKNGNDREIRLRILLPLLWAATALAISSFPACRGPVAELRVFHAAGFSPVVNEIRSDCESKLGVRLQTEASGSVEVCRKVTELGRAADVLILADHSLVARLLPGVCTWRIDFATDEIVLGVGIRAPHTELSEQSWPEVILKDDVRLARTDENVSPLGYRTLMVLRLQEEIGSKGLYDKFLTRCTRKVDDIERLVALLKTGECDYAFLHRSSAVAHRIRYIELDPRINLGFPDQDYARVSVQFRKPSSGAEETVVLHGAPAIWTLTQPERDANRAAAD
ncbi:MAG: substrate-binding domain-containing protein, partial [Kiritimatiellae bacterium]|nr:substrate-binding domain-containing protein [Kiritimatiellia bacterium]